MDIKKLEEAGIDYDEGLKRFSYKSQIYEKFLVKFADDPLFSELEQQIKSKNYTEAFKVAHSLKGMSGNLSINTFYKALCPIVEMLRNNQADDIENAFVELKNLYQVVIKAIR